MHNKPFTNGVITGILAIAAIAALVWVAPKAWDRQAKADCITLKAQSEQYPHFYLTSYEKAKCDSVKVEIKAPVNDKN